MRKSKEIEVNKK